MTDAAQMFQPLAAEEVAAAALAAGEVAAGADKVKPRPIVPMPEDAEPQGPFTKK